MSGAVEAACAVEGVARVGMVSGEKQLAEMKRQAELQARPLSQEEKEAIQRRRAACSERRKAALAKAETLMGRGVLPLQARIAQRRAALQEADSSLGVAKDFADMGSVDAIKVDDSSAIGRQMVPPLSLNTSMVMSGPTAKKPKNRITFSAMTEALQDTSKEAEDGIQAAQKLAASIFRVRFSDPHKKCTGRMTPRFGNGSGAKRSIDGIRRISADSNFPRDSLGSNVGMEAMVKRAAKAKSSKSDSSTDSSDLESNDAGAFRQRGKREANSGVRGAPSPLIAAHKAIRSSGAGFRRRRRAFVYGKVLAERGDVSGTGATALPPPPNRPPPQLPCRVLQQ